MGETVVGSIRDGERERAVVGAALNPDTFGKFYALFDGRRLPEIQYLHNILQRELGVRPDLADECLGILRENGEFAGIMSESEGIYLVRLPEREAPEPPGDTAAALDGVAAELPTTHRAEQQPRAAAHSAPPADAAKTIFIGHIGDSEAARYVASVLDEFGIASASSQIPEDDTGLLVPQDVSRAMRGSGAAVLVFRSGDNAWPSRDKMIGMLGAASVLFDDRVVILHEDGARMSISAEGLDGLNHIDFDHERPGESGMNLLFALHRAGVISVTA